MLPTFPPDGSPRKTAHESEDSWAVHTWVRGLELCQSRLLRVRHVDTVNPFNVVVSLPRDRRVSKPMVRAGLSTTLANPTHVGHTIRLLKANGGDPMKQRTGEHTTLASRTNIGTDNRAPCRVPIV